MSDLALRGVADTARWVAYFRALESERPDALFDDRHARVLAGDRGRRIAEELPTGPLAWSIAIRTKVFDELIGEALERHGVRTVLNLAAGLDTRPYRLALPPGLRWVEVDLPELVEAKSAVLQREPPRCKLERVQLDLRDRGARNDLFERLSKHAGPVLVVTEGLLIYLEESDVSSLADELRRHFPSGLWLLENASPLVLARMKRLWEKKLGAVDAQMKFAPPEGLRFYERHGWRPITERSLLEEAGRFRREMRVAAIVRSLSRFFPPLATAFARRQQRFRDVVVYALMGPMTPE